MINVKAVTAYIKIQKAADGGKIVRPDACELCGARPSRIQGVDMHGREFSRAAIVAHHWNGYDHPLEVWFICYHCNYKLRGRHDGSLTKDQAREFIKSNHS